MATAQQVIAQAKRYIGISGIDNIFNTWYWGFHCYDAAAYPWCAAFQSYIANELGGLGYEKSAAASGIFNQLPRIADKDVQRGDYVCFNWDGRTDTSWMDHIALVTEFDYSSGYLKVIEGNGGGGGGCVQETVYNNNSSYFTAFCRPQYSESASGSAGETDSGGIDIYYSVMLADGTVLPEIKNLEPDSSGDDFAGIAGREIYGIAIRVSAGSIKYRVRTVDGVLHEFVTGCDFADYWNGYAGDGEHAIATLETYLYSPNGDRYVYYRLSPVGQDYYPYQRDMDRNHLMDGWAGEPGVAVDRLQMYIGA